MCVTTLKTSDHIANLIRRLEAFKGESIMVPLSRADRFPSHQEYRENGELVPADVQAYRCARCTQYHTYSFTCWKPAESNDPGKAKKPRKKCRGRYGRGLRYSSGFSQIAWASKLAAEEDNNTSQVQQIDVLPAVEELDPATLRVPHDGSRALPKRDQRAVVFEFKRPPLYLTVPSSSAAEDGWTSDHVVSHLQALPDSTKDQIITALFAAKWFTIQALSWPASQDLLDMWQCNERSIEEQEEMRGRVIFLLLPKELQDRLTNMPSADAAKIVEAAYNCNTAAEFLGSAENSRSALFYLVKYLVKDAVEPAAVIAVVDKIRKHIKAYLQLPMMLGPRLGMRSISCKST